MSILTVTINDPSLEHKHSEVAYILGCLATVETEIGRGRGTVTSGSIVGAKNVSLGSWTYSPSASLP